MPESNNKMQVVSDNTIIMTDAINDKLSNITNLHKKVSNIKTPKAYIKKKMGLDYVEIGYMRDMADKHYQAGVGK